MLPQDLQTHLEALLNHWWLQPSDIPWEEGMLRWAGQRATSLRLRVGGRQPNVVNCALTPHFKYGCGADACKRTTGGTMLARSGGAMWTSTSTRRSTPLARSLASSSTETCSPATHPSFATLTSRKRSCLWTGVSCRRAYTVESRNRQGQSNNAHIRND